jgi:adsorption protein B
MLESTLYTIGLVLALLYLAMGFDDFIWDIYAFSKRKQYKKSRLDFQTLRHHAPKLLAMTIGAWNESDVIGEVIENLITSIQYPKSMYHIFVGVYPNDEKTIEIVSQIEKRVPNVHMVINHRPGPTTKAQNINYVITQIKEYEKQSGWRFASITIHDAEDVVHPYEFIVTNYLIERYDALQFPVFPLIEMPTFQNFFRNLTGHTYADEFAENHFSIMVGRYSTGAFVPSAGTGLALSRKTIDLFKTDEILPDGSLTEDYRLSLTLFEKGLDVRYVLDLLPRVKDDKVVMDFVATRSMFPATYKTAVKQKTRWIFGITMQSVSFKDVFAKNGLTFLGRYSIYKDLKAKIGNLLFFVGYPVLIYFIASLFIPLTPIYPIYSFSWYISLVITILMIERQLARAIAIYNVYGFRSVFFSCLFPPILPIRIVWGNIINLSATLQAYKLKFIGDKKKRQKTPKSEKVVWNKTDHTFLPKEILRRYHRTLGDVLIEKGAISPEALNEALKDKPYNKKIGKHLVQKGAISTAQLLTALAHIKGIQFVETEDFSFYDVVAFKSNFDRSLIEELRVLPILYYNGGYVIAYCERSPDNAQSILIETLGIKTYSVFIPSSKVREGLDIMYGIHPSNFKPNAAYELLGEERINAEQYILACNFAREMEVSPIEVLKHMGLTDEIRSLPVKAKPSLKSIVDDWLKTIVSYMN